MQTTRKISINFAPRIQAAGIQVASIGDSVVLKCMIKSKPIPRTMFWKDHDGRIPVIQSGNYDMTMMNDINDPKSYTMVLRILKLGAEDVGDYFCHAENALGSVTRPVSVRMRNTAAVTNIAECCAVQNVSTSCMDACSFYLDIESVIDRPECLADFDKLMKCASDGSDHRGCCAQKDVPRKCLNWCRGEPVTQGSAVCAIQFTKTIVGCFQENQNRLPGPPQNVMLEKILDDEVLVKWDAPVKNPSTVEGYRVFWHSADYRNENLTNTLSGLGTSRLDAKETSIKISGLEHNVLYELVVKAGNHYGNFIDFSFVDNILYFLILQTRCKCLIGTASLHTRRPDHVIALRWTRKRYGWHLRWPSSDNCVDCLGGILIYEIKKTEEQKRERWSSVREPQLLEGNKCGASSCELTEGEGVCLWV